MKCGSHMHWKTIRAEHLPDLQLRVPPEELPDRWPTGSGRWIGFGIVVAASNTLAEQGWSTAPLDSICRGGMLHSSNVTWQGRCFMRLGHVTWLLQSHTRLLHTHQNNVAVAGSLHSP